MKKNKKNKNGGIIVDINKVENEPNKEKKNVINKGIYNIKDFIAPPSFDRSNEEYMKVGNKFVRNFVLQGFPITVHVGWLDTIYNYGGDMDTAIYIEPTDERQALDDLTNKITQYEAQLSIEEEKGNRRNVTKFRNIIMNLYHEREKLEQNIESLFHVQITSNLYSDSKEELEKETQMIDNKLRGLKIFHMPTYLRQDDGYKSALPFGKTYLLDKFRNFSSGALTACFPFYNSDISHTQGILLGINLSTNTPMYIDFYDRDIMFNSNFTVLGESGSGKTFLVSLITMRSVLKNIRTAIIDPEGDYVKLTKKLQGANILLAQGSKQNINVFDIEEEDILDDDLNPTGVKIVNINEKVADLLNLIGVMAGDISRELISIISQLLKKLYEDRGFTENPESLYVKEPFFDESTGIFYHDNMKKPMPRFSDFHDLLTEYALSENNAELKSLSKALEMFKQGGIYDLFDCYTSEGLENLISSKIVNFNVSKLEENILRPIGMFVALSWTWEKFIKKNPSVFKRVVCDEAWMLLNKNMAGHEFTSKFLENTSRRIRKTKGGLLVASQNFKEFLDNPQGEAVLTNSYANIFLKQSTKDIDNVQSIFKLSDGEKLFLLQAKKGEMLIKIATESAIAYALPFEYEKQLIEKSKNIKETI